MDVHQQFELRVPIEAAFEYLSDPNRAMELLDPRFRVEWQGPMAVGTAFHLVAPNPKDHFDGAVDEFDPPRRVAYRMWVTSEPARRATVQMDFMPTASGTRIVGTATMTGRGAAERAAQWVIRPFLAIVQRRGARKLVRAIESDYAAAQASQ